jgi:hypothetical protein
MPSRRPVVGQVRVSIRDNEPVITSYTRRKWTSGPAKCTSYRATRVRSGTSPLRFSRTEVESHADGSSSAPRRLLDSSLVGVLLVAGTAEFRNFEGSGIVDRCAARPTCR